MDWTLIETDSDLLCGNRVKRHHIRKFIRLEMWEVIQEQWVLLLDHTPPLSFSASWVGGGLDPLATTGTVRHHGTEGPVAVPTHVIPRLSPGPGTVEAALGVQP